MSDTFNGFLVVMGQDIGEDEKDRIKAAIETLRGVASVEPLVADPQEAIARVRVTHYFYGLLFKALDEAYKLPHPWK